jgi:hypothetical protein
VLADRDYDMGAIAKTLERGQFEADQPIPQSHTDPE